MPSRFADRILLAVMAWRTNLTHRALAALFQVGVATVHRVITQLTRRVAGLLAPITNRRDLWVIDGTLIPVHDHTVTAKSNNYRRSVCVQVVIRARDRRVVALGAAWPGNRNDIVVHRATTAATTLAHSRVIGDGAYRAAPDITTPPPRRNDQRPLRVRRYFNRRRASVEHAIARLKDWQVLRQHRRRGDAINQTLRAVATVYNLRLDNPSPALRNTS